MCERTFNTDLIDYLLVYGADVIMAHKNLSLHFLLIRKYFAVTERKISQKLFKNTVKGRIYFGGIVLGKST